MMHRRRQVPGVAQGALQGGKYVAKIIATRGARPTRRAAPPFRYHDKGNMATIGRAAAVIATKHFARPACSRGWLWWVVHIMFLVGFRNRVLVMFQWAWSWLTFKRGARLITGEVGALPPVTTIAPTAPSRCRRRAAVAVELTEPERRLQRLQRA